VILEQFACTMRSMMRVAAIVLLGVSLLVAGCTDDGASPTTADERIAREVAIYLVRDGELAPVRRVVRYDSALEPVYPTLLKLFTGPTQDERASGYETAVTKPVAAGGTSGAPGRDGAVSTEGNTATLEWKRPLDDLALAQIVHTLTQFPAIDRVVVHGDDNAPPVTRKAFEEEAPQILIESPLPGDVVRSPIRLRGTANVFEATVSIEVRDQTGTVVLEAFTTATSGTGTRGTFDTQLVLPGASGTMTIVAFESSAKDGKPIHVTDVQVSVEP